MIKGIKGKKLLALLLAAAVILCSFPVVFAEETIEEPKAEDVTPVEETTPEEEVQRLKDGASHIVW